MSKTPSTDRPAAPTRLGTPFILASCVSLVAVLVLPWFVPGEPSPSISYAVGFNNRVAILAVLLGAGVLTLTASRRPVSPPTPRRPLFATAVSSQERIRPAWLFAILGAAAASSLTLSKLTYGDFRYGEMAYALDRLSCLLSGAQPYRQFEFAYGPLLLYAPSWAGRLFRLSPQGGYLVALAAWNLAGVLVLYYIVDRLGTSRHVRTALFVALGAYLVVNETMGMSYSYARALAPLAGLLLVDGLHRGRLTRQSERETLGSRGEALRLWATATAVVVVNAAISPELAVAAGAALLAYMGVEAWRLRGAYIAAVGAYSLTLVAASLVLVRIAGTLVAFVGGGGDLPVLPSPTILVYLFGVAVVAYMAPTFLRSRPDEAPIIVGATVLAIVLTPAVLSRADTGHVIMNSLTVVLLSTVGLGWWEDRMALRYVALLAGVFLVAHALQFAYLEGGPLRERLSLVSMGKVTVAQGGVDVGRFATLEPVAAPYEFPDGTGFALAERGWLSPTFYALTVVSRAQLRQQIASLAIARSVIVHDTAELDRRAAPSDGRPFDLSGLLMFPAILPQRHHAEPLGRELVNYIRKEFPHMERVGSYLLYERAGPVPGIKTPSTSERGSS